MVLLVMAEEACTSLGLNSSTLTKEGFQAVVDWVWKKVSFLSQTPGQLDTEDDDEQRRFFLGWELSCIYEFTFSPRRADFIWRHAAGPEDLHPVGGWRGTDQLLETISVSLSRDHLAYISKSKIGKRPSRPN